VLPIVEKINNSKSNYELEQAARPNTHCSMRRKYKIGCEVVKMSFWLPIGI
jgi:hypothetical protein